MRRKHDKNTICITIVANRFCMELEFVGTGEFGASGRAMTMKIGRRVRELHKLT